MEMEIWVCQHSNTNDARGGADGLTYIIRRYQWSHCQWSYIISNIHIMISPTTKAHSLVILWGKFQYWTQYVCKNRICTLTVRSQSGDVAASRQPAGQWHLSRTFDATSAANFMMETQLIYQISWCTDILSLNVILLTISRISAALIYFYKLWFIRCMCVRPLSYKLVL